MIGLKNDVSSAWVKGLIMGIFLLGGGCSLAIAEMPRVSLSVGMYRLQVEAAVDLQDRMQGLMNRKTLGADTGMVFGFPKAERHCMWMKNTLIPLSVAFMDAGGMILNIDEKMQPQTETNHCATAPALYALEMNQGWFAKHGIRPGMVIRGLEQLPPAW